MSSVLATAALLASALLLCSMQMAHSYSNDALADQINSLPGADKLNVGFNQFSGYLSVGQSLTKNMHYWYVESEKDPKTDPLVFWTNGGPGCSGLLGFFTEQGPFRPQKDGTLKLNAYAWNKVANMVFIESPCGVGFSYSDNKDDYEADDDSTALDNYDLIQAFLARFPDLRANDLYITSESYGGHYMPTLAQEIVNQNIKASSSLQINFKGFAVGNPFTTTYSGIPASIETYWGHQIVSKPLYSQWAANCIQPSQFNGGMCEDLFLAFYHQTANLNPYALDYPVCLDEKSGGAAKYGRTQRLAFFNFMFATASNKMRTDLGLSAKYTTPSSMLVVSDDYEPCSDVYTTNYLNRADVKSAIHVNSNVEWQECSYSVRYNQADSLKSMVPIYQSLINGNNGLNILVYSGDDDSVCGTVGTQSWIWDMGYTAGLTNTWQEYEFEGQTAGFITKWPKQKLAFVTVRGAGHEVPAYKPEVALDLFTKYLQGYWTGAN